MMLRFTFVDVWDDVHVVIHDAAGRRLHTYVTPQETVQEWNRSVEDGDLRFLENHAAENDLAESLGSGLLPAGLAETFTSGGHTDSTLIVHASPSVATIPFGLLAVSPGVRLMQRCRVRWAHAYGLSTTKSARANNGNLLAVVDPHSQMQPVLDGEGHARWRHYCERNSSIRDAGDFVSRYDLHRHLTATSPEALLFYGHCTSNQATPLSGSGLVLSDRDYSCDEATPRPLTAHDFVVGTLTHSEKGLPRDTRGSEIWPMPAKTAILGCSSGSTARSIEPLGLASVLYTSGAEWLAATLWDVPADAANGGFTTTMAMAVADVLMHRDPGNTLDRWLLSQLDRWRTGADGASSPRTWGALAQFVGETSDLRQPSTP